MQRATSTLESASTTTAAKVAIIIPVPVSEYLTSKAPDDKDHTYRENYSVLRLTACKTRPRKP